MNETYVSKGDCRKTDVVRLDFLMKFYLHIENPLGCYWKECPSLDIPRTYTKGLKAPKERRKPLNHKKVDSTFQTDWPY